jgi:cadmium resistance protein CadD (predicted permease)
VLHVSRDEAQYLGLIPTAIGLAYLVYYFVEGREIEREQIKEELKKKSGGEEVS